MPESSELPAIVKAYLILAAGAGASVACLWLLYVRGQPLWPRPRRRVAPWTGFEIALVIFFVFFFWQHICSISLNNIFCPRSNFQNSAEAGLHIFKFAHYTTIFGHAK